MFYAYRIKHGQWNATGWISAAHALALLARFYRNGILNPNLVTIERRPA